MIPAMILSLSLVTASSHLPEPLACGPRANLVELLKEEYGQTRRWLGLSRGKLVETYASERGTWTTIVTSPLGLSCVVDAGRSYQPDAMAEEGRRA